MTRSSKVILAGGNGYIGGTTAFSLKEAGFEPIILDNFSTSKRNTLSGFPIFEVDLNDLEATGKVFQQLGTVSAIIHFAAKALVPESFEVPEVYYKNNLNSTFHLAELAHQFKVPVFVHSSSCAVYGVPQSVPISETAPFQASSPYGDTKVMAEVFLSRYCRLKNIRLLNLRYFNPAGAWTKYGWGEAHEPETHLIPNIIGALIHGNPVTVFGKNHPTPDGSCIRDFIHVVDLAEAHVLAVKALLSNKSLPNCLNVGRGVGSSVLEVIQSARKITGKQIEVIFEPPRPGDPPQLVADSKKMQEVLQWKPPRNLEQMIQDDWNWRLSSLK